VVSKVFRLTEVAPIRLNRGGEIPISQFPKKLIKVKDIYYDDEKVFWEYSLDHPERGIHVPGYKDKDVVVEYYYIPNYKDGNSKSDLPISMLDVLIYGVIAEYLLVTGDYFGAKKYSRKYSKSIYFGNRKKLLRKLGGDLG
jgi:hypothetical protein